jgi:hypothetical protein
MLQIQDLLKNLHPSHWWNNGNAPKKINGVHGIKGINGVNAHNGHHAGLETQQSHEEATPLLPLLIFRDKICIPVTRMEDDNLLIFHPKENTLLLRFVLGQEESHGFYLSPKLTSADLFADKALQSYSVALRDPLLRTLPYVLETYRVLESAYRRPAYRIMEPTGNPDEGYLLKYYCEDAFGSVSGQITCRVLFFQNRVLFTSPVMTELKAALRQVLMLKPPEFQPKFDELRV